MLSLAPTLIAAPPIDLWPQVERRAAVHADVEQLMLELLAAALPGSHQDERRLRGAESGATNVADGSVLGFPAVEKQSPARREPPQWIRTTAVPRTADIQASACRRAVRLLGGGSVSTAAAGHRQQSLEAVG